MTYHLRIYIFNLKCVITVIKLKLDNMRDKGSAKQKSETINKIYSHVYHFFPPKLTLIRQIKIKLQIKSWVPLH